MIETIGDVLISAEEIGRKVRELGGRISEDYAGKDPVLVGVLKGSVVFLADLMRAISVPHRVDFMAVSSYGSGTETSGVVRITKDLDESITGEDVLIVEDIVDTGLTLHYLLDLLQARRPKSLRVCAFLDKPSRRQVDIAVAYRGFEIPDDFVVGYGLDYDQRYRNLPDVRVLVRQDRRA